MFNYKMLFSIVTLLHEFFMYEIYLLIFSFGRGDMDQLDCD